MVSLNKINESAGIVETIMDELDIPAEQFRGYGLTAEDAMRNAVGSGNVTWQTEEPTTWAEIVQDALKAAILTFTRTPNGVLITDNN